jgi:hypothetical protein
MDAMEAELQAKRAKSSATSASTTTKPSSTSTARPTSPKPSARFALDSLPTEDDLDEMDEDDLAAMDRELRAALKNAGADDDEDEDMEGLELDEETRKALGSLGQGEKDELKMMKEFMDSYKAQSGSSGVVGNLFGRLSETKK